MSFQCASFFTGVGGIEIGFSQAGFNTVYLNEVDKFAVKTLQQNFTVNIDQRDIREVKPTELPKFNVLLAGFPCQSFSIAGNRKGFKDERGNLFFELERIFKETQPEVMFFENVKNLLTHDKGNTIDVILNILDKNGYYVKYQVMNTKDFGNIPQNRERIYIVCFRSEKAFHKFEFPREVKLNREWADFLEKTVPEKYYYYHTHTTMYEQIKDVIKNSNSVYQWRRKYVRENKSKVCPTLTANMGTGGHNVPLINPTGDEIGIRKLTPRECFNLQGFPIEYELPKDVSDSQLYKQAGNSVTVPVIYKIAKQIKKSVEE